MPVSVKVSEGSYAKLKWMKNRYSAVSGNDLTWDDFINKLLMDALFPLAYTFKEKNPNMTVESIRTFLVGAYFSISEISEESRKMWEIIEKGVE